MIDQAEKKIIEEILSYEHRKVAHSLNLINSDIPGLDSKLLYEAIGLIDRLSRNDDDLSRKIIVMLCAILWTYKKPEWSGLKNFFVVVLSRVGFSPSSIMIDDEYDYENRKYSAMPSLIDELSIVINQLKDEVSIQDKTFLLTRFQKNIWDKIATNKILGISAPTSAGKSFIIALKTIDILLKGPGTIIYIVPTLSLVSQVSIDFRKLLDQFKLRDYEILNSYIGKYSNDKKIFVLTQEKAIGAFSQGDTPFKNVKMLVIDEVQNVERVADDDDQRAKTLYDLLLEFRHSTLPERIVISGPRIEKIGNLGVEVFGEETEEEDSKSSPVSSVTYAISKKQNEYFFKQYADIVPTPLVLPIENTSQIAGIGRIQYREDFHKFLLKFLKSLGPDTVNIIFSPKPSQSRRTALSIINTLSIPESDRLNSLINYLSSTVHPSYDLCKTLRSGVAYHHGKLPHHVRRVLEKAIAEKLIKNIVCTTTLMQGVNLPAQNVIIRNPNLYISRRHGEPRLTNYEIANLRGRAGRLLKDLLGRTFVLDENAFEDSEDIQGELFKDATKEINVGYGHFFAENQMAIEKGLLNNETPKEDNKEYAFLMTYIRQTIMRHGVDAKKRFQSVNIKLDDLKFDKIREQLLDLKVPLEICAKNRYWDPIDLNKLFLRKNEFLLPSSATAGSVAYKLRNLVIDIRKAFPFYYEKYLNLNLHILESVCINAEKWLKEKPLKAILDTPFHDDPQKLENTINILQNKIAFGLPMFLKPIYDILLPTSAFLRFIELGAYRPVTRRLVEYNIPRETAIYLTDNFLGNLDVDSANFDKELIEKIKNNFHKLDYWIQIQLEAVV